MTTESEARGDILAAVDAYGEVVKAPLEQQIASQQDQIATLNEETTSLQQQVTLLQSDNTVKAGEIAALQQQVASLSADLLSQETENGLLVEEIARLQALLDALQPGPDTQFGFSRPDATWLMPVAVPGYRTYLSPGQRPQQVSSNSGLRRAQTWLAEDGILWLSIKDEAGPWFDALVRDILEQFPTQRIFLTSRHEPREFWDGDGGLTLADYDRHQDKFEAVVEAIGDPRITMWTIVEGWHEPSRSPGYWERMSRPKQKFGLDSYNAGIQNPNRYEPVEDVFGPGIEFARSKGTEFPAFAETGTGLTPDDTDGSGRVAWLTAAREYLDGQVEAAFIWNQGGCTLTVAEAEYWAHG